MLTATPRLIRVALALSVAAVSVALLWGVLSFYYLGGRFLGLEEKVEPVVEIDIQTGDTVTPDRLLEWLGIARDAPLFDRRDGLFPGAFRARYRRAAASPTLASLSVSRLFGGRVVIRATERVPLARIIPARGLVIDRDGYVFPCSRKGVEQMVALEGTPLSTIEAGNRLVTSSLDTGELPSLGDGRIVTSAMGVAALRLLECVADGGRGIRVSDIASIDIDHVDYVMMRFRDSRTAKIAWQYMKSSSDLDGRKYLEAQLDGLFGTMTERGGRGHRNFDMTIKGRGFGL